MEIFQAKLDDLEAVSKLFNLYRMFYGKQSNETAAKAYIKERLERQESVIFAAKDRGTYTGFTQLYPMFSSISMKRTWILNDLFVTEEARNQGIGAKLLNAAKEHAQKTGAASLSLQTARDNEMAQHLYEKNGYKRDTVFFHYDLPVY